MGKAVDPRCPYTDMMAVLLDGEMAEWLKAAVC